MRISVIVPVGDEKAWRHCRSSLEASIGRYGGAVQFEIVQCMDLEHKGVNVARNNGLSKAVGDWIAWVDADDAVADNWANVIAQEVHTMDQDCGDVLSFGARLKSSRNRQYEICYLKVPGVVPATDFLKDCLVDVGGSTWLWNKVFRRSLFDDLCFRGVTQEDFRIMPRVMSRARHVRVIPDVIYEYNRPEGSLTHDGGGSRNAEGIIAAIRDDLSDVPCAKKLLHAWKEGCAIRAADCVYNSGRNAELMSFLRRNLWRIIFDRRQGVRVKGKAILASAGITRTGH